MPVKDCLGSSVPLASSVTLGKLLNLSVPHFPHLQNENDMWLIRVPGHGKHSTCQWLTFPTPNRFV